MNTLENRRLAMLNAARDAARIVAIDHETMLHNLDDAGAMGIRDLVCAFKEELERRLGKETD